MRHVRQAPIDFIIFYFLTRPATGALAREARPSKRSRRRFWLLGPEPSVLLPFSSFPAFTVENGSDPPSIGSAQARVAVEAEHILCDLRDQNSRAGPGQISADRVLPGISLEPLVLLWLDVLALEFLVGPPSAAFAVMRHAFGE